MLFSILLVVAYLFGSISSAIIICKLSGLPDPRTQGSGNPGATNVLRVGGKKYAALVLAGDVIKGVIPVVLAWLFGIEQSLIAWIALAAVIGHLFPIFFKFQGGKGVATSFGGLVALSPLVGTFLLATWLLVAFVFRYSSLAAVAATILAPFYIYCFADSRGGVLPIAIMSLLVLWRHKSNIINLYRKTEDKIEF